MSAFKDIDTFFKIKPLKLPIRGKTYSFPGSISGRTGLLLHRMTEMAEAAQSGKGGAGFDDELLDDAGEVDLRAEIMGDAEQAMIKDDVPSVYVEHAFRTLICWHQFGEDIAVKIWEDVPGAPKGPADHKPKASKGTSVKATTTKKPVSSTRTSKSIPASAGDASSDSGPSLS